MTDPTLADLCRDYRADIAESRERDDLGIEISLDGLAQLLDAAERCEKAEAEIKRDEESTDRTWTLLGNTYGGSGTMLHEAVGRCLRHVADLEKRLAEAERGCRDNGIAHRALSAGADYEEERDYTLRLEEKVADLQRQNDSWGIRVVAAEQEAAGLATACSAQRSRIADLEKRLAEEKQLHRSTMHELGQTRLQLAELAEEK